MVGKKRPERTKGFFSFVRTFSLFVLTIGLAMPAGAYAAAGAVPVTTRIEVSCEGKNTDETFIYDLETDNDQYQKISSKTLALKNGEKGQFDITFEVPGTYHYTLSQREGQDAATTYDDTVYTVDVYVTEDDNGIMYTDTVAYVDGEKEKKTEVVFKNEKKLSPKEKRKSVKTSDSEGAYMWPFLTVGSSFTAAFLLACMASCRKRKIKR